MKTIGIIGGMSWESTGEYYRLINQMAKELLGGLHSAKVIVYSVDFDEIETLQSKGEWNKLADMMIEAARNLEAGGAQLLLIATNTMHKVAQKVEQATSLPFIHIADGVAEAIRKQGLQKVLLLGTRFTMEGGFYVERIHQTYPVEIVIPTDEEKQMVHDIIFEELILGDFVPASRQKIVDLVAHYAGEGVEGVILGCTELPLLIAQSHVVLPVFESTKLHVRAAVMRAIPGLA